MTDLVLSPLFPTPPHRSTSTSIWLAILLAVTLRAGMGLGPHSGEQTPPRFGDFEAQRHWMELTLHLPVEEWYRGTHPDNDLQYWGLDYPPLTAYHSKMCGFMVNTTAPHSVALGSSKGKEDISTKAWMRGLSLVSDAFTFIPAMVAYFVFDTKLLAVALISPTMIVIDHGHFQFNAVAHGFVVFAVLLLEPHYTTRTTTITWWQAALASISFCSALNFKQMTLYYAPAMFIYLLRWCSGVDSKTTMLFRLVLLANVVVWTFLVLWAPFLSSTNSFLAVVRRVFPFERGIFEDKVANFWCTFNSMVKIRTIFSQRILAMMAAVLSAMFSFVPVMFGATRKNPAFLRQSLLVSSLSFFLFSFQVHEKSILLPCVASLLLLPVDPYVTILFQLSAMYGMVPLLARDGIALTSAACTALFLWFAILAFGIPSLHHNVFAITVIVINMLIALCMCVLVVGQITTPIPSLPDLWVVLLEAHAFVMYCLFYVLTTYGLWMGNPNAFLTTTQWQDVTSRIKQE